MEAAKCRFCGKREWGHVCDQTPVLPEPKAKAQVSQAVKPEPGCQPEHAPAALAPKWKTREEYNAYMKAYMRKWRAKG